MGETIADRIIRIAKINIIQIMNNKNPINIIPTNKIITRIIIKLIKMIIDISKDLKQAKTILSINKKIDSRIRGTEVNRKDLIIMKIITNKIEINQMKK